MPDAPILVVVHPDSACGSGAFHLGRTGASEARDELVAEFRAHRGGCIVLHGDFADELPRFGYYATALNDCLRRARAGGFPSAAVTDPDPGRVVGIARDLGLPPSTAFVVTGAWTSDARDHCVDHAVEALRAAGYADVRMSANAVNIDGPPNGPAPDPSEACAVPGI